MLAAIYDQPKLSQLFMNHLLNRNSQIEADVVDSSEKRLARLLLLLANYGKEGSPPIVPVTVSQETLAAMIGTTRSRVSHFMNKFRRAGFIAYNGTIDVHQSLLTSVLHDAPAIREVEDEATSLSGTMSEHRIARRCRMLKADTIKSAAAELTALFETGARSGDLSPTASCFLSLAIFKQPCRIVWQ